jgi:hypothetical protein
MFSASPPTGDTKPNAAALRVKVETWITLRERDRLNRRRRLGRACGARVKFVVIDFVAGRGLQPRRRTRLTRSLRFGGGMPSLSLNSGAKADILVSPPSAISGLM